MDWPGILDLIGFLLMFGVLLRRLTIPRGSDIREDLYLSLGSLGWFLICVGQVAELGGAAVQTNGRLISTMSLGALFALACGASLGRAHLRGQQRRKTAIAPSAPV